MKNQYFPNLISNWNLLTSLGGCKKENTLIEHIVHFGIDDATNHDYD